MGRKPRVEYVGATYHVIQRGNNQEYIFERDEDKHYLLRDLAESMLGLGYTLFAYVLMGNHYHLVLQTGESPLNKVMHRINGNYGRYYNHKYKRSGHVFGSRYKALLIQDEQYLMAVVRYVHQNPVRAGLCRRVTEYPWSSDAYYRYNDRGGLVEIDLVLDYLSRDRVGAIEQYSSLMEEQDDMHHEEMKMVSEEDFLQPIVTAQEIHAGSRKTLDQILLATGVSPVDFMLIKEGSRRRHLVPYKKAYAQEAAGQRYTRKEIGDNISLSDVAVLHLIRE